MFHTLSSCSRAVFLAFTRLISVPPLPPTCTFPNPMCHRRSKHMVPGSKPKSMRMDRVELLGVYFQICANVNLSSSLASLYLVYLGKVLPETMALVQLPKALSPFTCTVCSAICVTHPVCLTCLEAISFKNVSSK